MTGIESQLLIFIVFLTARLFSLYRAQPMHWHSLLAALVVQVLGSGVLYCVAPWTLLPSLALLALLVADFFLCRLRINGELLHLLTLAIGALFVFALPWWGLLPQGPATGGFFPISGLRVLMGWVLCLNEVNLLVRIIIARPQSSPVGDEEYNTGRKIGLLERTSAYGLVALGDFTAIGLIIAAKGVARFKEFENRVFAEYFVIGTLASIILAVAMGLLFAR